MSAVTHETRQNHSSSVPVSSSSGLSQGVFKVCSALGLRYLRIDSLCKEVCAIERSVDHKTGVFQVDNLKIIVEAHRVADVYGHVVCNIKVLTAARGGMFKKRNAQFVLPATTILQALEIGLASSYAVADE